MTARRYIRRALLAHFVLKSATTLGGERAASGEAFPRHRGLPNAPRARARPCISFWFPRGLESIPQWPTKKTLSVMGLFHYSSFVDPTYIHTETDNRHTKLLFIPLDAIESSFGLRTSSPPVIVSPSLSRGRKHFCPLPLYPVPQGCFAHVVNGRYDVVHGTFRVKCSCYALSCRPKTAVRRRIKSRRNWWPTRWYNCKHREQAQIKMVH